MRFGPTLRLLMCLALGWPLLALARPPAPAPAERSERQETVLASRWRFHFGEAGQGVTEAGFDDSGWQAVEVPHTWNRVGHYLPDPASHINRPETIDKTQGVGWYRLAFTPPDGFQGKRAWL